MITQPTPGRRHVVLEVLTAPIGFLPGHGASVGLEHRIACIAMLIDNGVDVGEYCFSEGSEAEILSAFWKRIRPNDVVVGGNNVESQWALLCHREIPYVNPALVSDPKMRYQHDVICLDGASARQVISRSLHSAESRCDACLQAVRAIHELLWKASDDGPGRLR